MRPIDADALYERAATLEAQALDYVGKLIERDGNETSVEWKIWSAILNERTAFKHDLMDAPTIDPVRHGYWKETDDPMFMACSVCGHSEYWGFCNNYCPNCGAKMDGGKDNETD